MNFINLVFRNFSRFNSTKMNEKPTCEPKRLAAFDFDMTIINENADFVVKRLLKPSSYEEYSKKYTWPSYMKMIFECLHQQNVKPSEIQNIIKIIPETRNMINFINLLKSRNFDVIIISDANSLFINDWLVANDVRHQIKEIYTNSAEFDSNGLLNVTPYTDQITCSLCPRHMCKGQILSRYLLDSLKQRNESYCQVFYIGDGSNDICPVLTLGAMDYGCARIGFRLEKHIFDVGKQPGNRLDATIIRWENGTDLIEKIENALNEPIKEVATGMPGNRKFK